MSARSTRPQCDVPALLGEALQRYERFGSPRMDGGGYLRLSRCFPSRLLDPLGEEARALADSHARRRDVQVAETGGSPRHLSNVVKRDVDRFGSLVPEIYAQPDLLDILSRAVGEEVRRCPFDAERYLVISHEKRGDTHGWHWGDYSYVLVWVVSTPAPDDGGVLECVPGTEWNKENPLVEEWLGSGEVTAHEHVAGDVFLLKARTTLHRTTPLARDCERVIVRMAFAGPGDVDEPCHSTMEQAFM